MHCACLLPNITPFAQIYHLASKVPSWVRAIAPKGSLEIHEEAWNAYPYCKTVLSNPGYMKDGFYIMVETYHIADKGDSENVHELPKVKDQSWRCCKLIIMMCSSCSTGQAVEAGGCSYRHCQRFGDTERLQVG